MIALQTLLEAGDEVFVRSLPTVARDPRALGCRAVHRPLLLRAGGGTDLDFLETRLTSGRRWSSSISHNPTGFLPSALFCAPGSLSRKVGFTCFPMIHRMLEHDAATRLAAADIYELAVSRGLSKSFGFPACASATSHAGQGCAEKSV